MNENLGSIICQRRQAKKLTQEEFASRLGVTPQAISKWERGNGLPDISFIGGICSILGISADTLLGIQSSIAENSDITAENEIKNNLAAEPLVLEFGEHFIPCIVTGLKEGYLKDFINEKRVELASRTGMLMPLLRFKDNLELGKNSYRILSYDKELFACNVNNIDNDTYKLLITQVMETCQDNYHTIINKHIVKLMVGNIKEKFPGAADGLVPEKISYLQLERKLQEIIKHGGTIRDLIHILEEMEEDYFRKTCSCSLYPDIV